MIGHKQTGWLRLYGVLVVGALAWGCGDDITEPPPGGNVPDTAVTVFLNDLPSWAAFSPDTIPDSPPTPVGMPAVLPDTVVTDSVADDGSLAPIPPVTYACTETDYSMATTPDEIVMYSPDSDILWPGALIQGQSHKNPLGSLLGLTIAQRTPINVSIPELSGGGNFRTVDVPNQATVANAISEMVGDATTANLGTPSSINYVEETSYSAQQFALSARISGKYLGFSAAASGSFSRTANETTVSVQFTEKMFTAQVAPPQTPDAFFSADFTGTALQQQVSQGNIGPDNIPVYVSKVVYGRMMIYNFTSTASEVEIKAAIDAAYDVGFANISASLRSKYEKILRTARVTVQTLGGPSQLALDLIRSGNRSDFFTDAAPLSTAVPLSYEFKGLSNGNPIASVTEATSFTIKECTARPATPGAFTLLPSQTEAGVAFVPDSILVSDVDNDSFDDLVFNELGANNRFYIAYSDGGGGFTFDTVITHPDTPAEGWANYEVAMADINGDGLADFVWNHLGTENKTYFGVRQAGGGYAFPGVRVHPNQGWGSYRMVIANVDNDVDDDIVWSHSNGQRFYVGQTGAMNTLAFPGFQEHPNGGSGTTMLLVGDLDGNNGQDLVWSRFSGTGNTAWVATSDGLGAFNLLNNNHGVTASSWADYQSSLGDVDNMNGADLINYVSGIVDPTTSAIQRMTSIFLRQANGSGGFGADTVMVPNGTDVGVNNGPFAWTVGDFNGDGRSDILWNKLSSVNHAYVGLGLANATFDFSPQRTMHSDVENWALYALKSGDFNGDGRTDVLWIKPAVDTKLYVGLGKP